MTAIFKNWRTSFERIEKYISDTYFTDVNLSSLIIVEESELFEIDHLTISTNPAKSTEDSLHLFDDSALKFESISSFSDDKWEKVDQKSFTFGFTWSVHWFRIRCRVPRSWFNRHDHRIEFHWDSGCEALVFSKSGRPLTGLNSTHHRVAVDLRLLPDSSDDDDHTFYLQVSCSDLFGAGKSGLISPPNPDKSFRIELARLRLINRSAVVLRWDLKLLMQLAESLKDTDIGHRALFLANEVINILVDLRSDRKSPTKLARARDLIEKFFCIPGTPSSGGGDNESVILHAIGHCHIDTAWLWRYGETRRKISRSWSSSLRLLERYSTMRFVCSQAQQLAWLRDDHPGLFKELCSAAETGGFVPMGGTWVEMDVQLPCCESLCRQFLFGQRFFRHHFRSYSTEFWLPDTFGYSTQLPQIMRLARIGRFVTQKLSWSLVNKFPHHSFYWVGLDGSEVLAHFPPGDSYSMQANVAEVVHSASNFMDKGRSAHLMFLYGHGDGGQGPTEEMLHALDRMAHSPGLPRIEHSSPSEFFNRVEAEQARQREEGGPGLCRWQGELFLELHNGTYTTQRHLKVGNAHCEQMLRAVEMLASIGCCDSSMLSPVAMDVVFHEQLDRQWEALLLGQFHDVLPGSSIEQACEDAWYSHRSVLAWCQNSIQHLVRSLGITGPFLVNPTSWPLTMPVMTTGATECQSESHPVIFSGLVVGAHSVRAITAEDRHQGDVHFNNSVVASDDRVYGLVTYRHDKSSGLHFLTNQHMEVQVDQHCRIVALHLLNSPMNVITKDGFANQLVLFDDVPLYWDAWDVMDYHLETGVPIEAVASYELLEPARLLHDATDQSATLKATMRLSSSGTLIENSVSIQQHLPYVPVVTKVLEWHETHRMLKVQFATRANAVDAQYRTQAGYHSRPTHRNTSWDAAKFEVCGHDWVHVGEANWGFGLLKDAIFGSSVSGGTINLSLLRSPSSPDPTADKKHLPHVFNYAVYPYCSTTDEPNNFATITRLATQFSWLCAWNASIGSVVIDANLLHPSDFNRVERSFPIKLVSPQHGEVAIDWIKQSCEDANKFVIRLHEQIGGRYPVKIASQLAIADARVVDILEEHVDVWNADDSVITVGTHCIDLFILPFRIVSVMVTFQ